MFLTAYWKPEGQTPVQMYETDARNAVGRFPNEWSLSPWPEDPPPEAAPDPAPPAAAPAGRK